MAQNTRARSANGDDRVGANQEGIAPGQPDVQAEMFRQLIQELRRDRQDKHNRLELPPQPAQPQPENFKPPEYSGVGSVEVFIRQFLDVAEANGWGERTAVLHLRRALKDEARDCGGIYETMAEIFTALRARFGISPREARVRLSAAKRDFNTPLQAHANRIKELVGIAYPDMPRDIQEQMTLDQFINTLNQARLQEHLLAVRPDHLTEAITAGNEYLNVRGSQTRIKQVEVAADEESEIEEQVMPVRTSPPAMAQTVLPATTELGQPTQPVFTQPATVPPTSVPGQHSPAMTQQVPQAAHPGHFGLAQPNQPVTPRPVPAQPFQVPNQLSSATPYLTQFNPYMAGGLMGGPVDPMAALLAAVTQLTNRLETPRQNRGAGSEKRGLTCWNCGKPGHVKSQCREPLKEAGNKGGQQ